MSKVIKAPIWREDARVIGTPQEKKGREPAEEEVVPGFDEEAQKRMLEEIAEKEQRASQMLQDARVSSDMIKQEAQNEHDRLIEEAHSQVESIKEKAREEGKKEGFEAGIAEGKEQALQEMQDAVKEANEKAMRTLQIAKEATDDYLMQAERDVAEVVMCVVEKILPQHFIDVPQVILPAVKQAILKVKDQKELHVHVPPDSYEFVLMARDEFRSMLTGGNAILEVVSDESLKPGDCLIETTNGTVDARLATQIELIKNAVQEILR